MKIMEAGYELIETNPKAPIKNLIRILRGDKELITSLDVFGPDYFRNNIAKIQESYSRPQTGEIINFREPTTAESILAASYDFENRVKRMISNPRWLQDGRMEITSYPKFLQLGRIVKTSEGVFANPPKDENGNPVTNEDELKSYLNRAKPIKVDKGRIYIVSDSEQLRDFGFADYDSFERGPQDYDTFLQGGLARVLEHTEKPAEAFSQIVSKENYPMGVKVCDFDSVERPALILVLLDAVGYSDDDFRLNVNGEDLRNVGYAFGVLNKSATGTSQIL